MEDQEKKVSSAVLRCLEARLNNYVLAGKLISREADAASVLASKEGYEKNADALRNSQSSVFADSSPVPWNRYRRNRYSDGAFSLAVWHSDAEGPWVFIPADDNRFTGLPRPSYDKGWGLLRYSSRGEFRQHADVTAAIGEAEIIASAEVAETAK